MPWPALSFTSPAIGLLNKAVDLSGIPTVLVIARDGTVVCADASERLCDDPTAFPWERKALEASVGSCVCFGGFAVIGAATSTYMSTPT